LKLEKEKHGKTSKAVTVSCIQQVFWYNVFCYLFHTIFNILYYITYYYNTIFILHIFKIPFIISPAFIIICLQVCIVRLGSGELKQLIFLDWEDKLIYTFLNRIYKEFWFLFFFLYTESSTTIKWNYFFQEGVFIVSCILKQVFAAIFARRQKIWIAFIFYFYSLQHWLK